jgi:hypothetical protein
MLSSIKEQNRRALSTFKFTVLSSIKEMEESLSSRATSLTSMLSSLSTLRQHSNSDVSNDSINDHCEAAAAADPNSNSLFWSVSAQQGFKYIERANAPQRNNIGLSLMPWQRNSPVAPLHSEMEDASFPQLQETAQTQPPLRHRINHSQFQIWVLADGHGGAEAANWFTQEVYVAARKIIQKENCK